MLLEAQPDAQVVWDRFRHDLHRFILRRVGDEAVADDLLQDSFEKIHRGIDSLSDESRLAPWVYTVVRNVVRDYYRRPDRTEALDEIEDPEADEENVENRLIGGWLIATIGDLPDRYRDAVRMAEIDGLTQTEIAGRLGLSVSGAKSRVQRGREMLRKALGRCCHVEFDRRGNVVDYRSKSGCC